MRRVSRRGLVGPSIFIPGSMIHGMIMDYGYLWVNVYIAAGLFEGTAGRIMEWEWREAHEGGLRT
ncbi:MAG: hypothetical protein ACLP5H_20410 [Desulfomonilaceae bacterium]